MPNNYHNNKYQNFNLRIIRDGNVPAPKQHLPLADVRTSMRAAINDYLDHGKGNILLLRGAAGIGKSHMMVDVAQKATDYGYRVMWASERIGSYFDLANMPHFIPSLWLQWIPLEGTDPISGSPMCQHRDAQSAWMAAGNSYRHFCNQICTADDQARCPYVQQHCRTEPIVHLRHQHLVSGTGLPDFDIAIIDESPIGALLHERIIPPDRLEIPGASDNIQSFIDWIKEQVTYHERRAKWNKKWHTEGDTNRTAGMELSTRAEIFLGDELSNSQHFRQPTPSVRSPQDALSIPYQWIDDATALIKSEAELMKKLRLDRWAERIFIDERGLHLLKKRNLSFNFPDWVFLLDSTSDEKIVKSLFDKEIKLFDPQVERTGKIYQICRRTNGVSALSEGEKESEESKIPPLLSRDEAYSLVMDFFFSEGCSDETSCSQSKRTASEEVNQSFDSQTPPEPVAFLINTIKRIIAQYGYKDPLIVCHKRFERFFAAEFGKSSVAHFGALRGSNKYQTKDALFVAGSPSANPRDIEKYALMLWPDREDAYELDITYEVIRYKLSQAGLANLRDDYGEDAVAVERLLGKFKEPDLELIAKQFRQAELYQIIHRLRLVLRYAVVWLLTATETGEEIDWIMHDAPTHPRGISEDTWMRLKRYLAYAEMTGEIVTYDSLEKNTKVSLSELKHNKILRKIADFQPGRWELVKLPSEQRGPKQIGLRPILFSNGNDVSRESVQGGAQDTGAGNQE